jgi:putative PIN family toxin of toxin-antitoxin system
VNVLVDSGFTSSALDFSGTPKDALVKAIFKSRLLICSQIEDEVVRIMQKKFGHYPQEIRDLLTFYTRDAVRVSVMGKLPPVCRDPKDDFVLECAILGKADLIITGDKDLLSLGHYQAIRILTPRQYLDAPQHPRGNPTQSSV